MKSSLVIGDRSLVNGEILAEVEEFRWSEELFEFEGALQFIFG